MNGQTGPRGPSVRACLLHGLVDDGIVYGSNGPNTLAWWRSGTRSDMFVFSRCSIAANKTAYTCTCKECSMTLNTCSNAMLRPSHDAR